VSGGGQAKGNAPAEASARAGDKNVGSGTHRDHFGILAAEAL
jgi:hypothetical protein